MAAPLVEVLQEQEFAHRFEREAEATAPAIEQQAVEWALTVPSFERRVSSTMTCENLLWGTPGLSVMAMGVI